MDITRLIDPKQNLWLTEGDPNSMFRYFQSHIYVYHNILKCVENFKYKRRGEEEQLRRKN